MKIVDVQWRDYRLPFLNSFSTAHGVMTSREGIIVQVTTGQGISGIGEIAPLPALGGGSLADARRLLPVLVARLHGKTLHEALDLVLTEGKTGNIGASATSGVWWGGVALGESRPSESRARIDTSCPSPSAASGVWWGEWPSESCGPRRVERVSILRPALSTSTLCGLEIALLDLIGKAEGCGVCTLLSPAGSAPRAAVPVNAVIGARATEAAIATARDARKNGFRCVKLKVGWGVSVHEETERVAAVRDAIGPAMHLRLDANEAWNLEEAIVILSQCVPYDIQYVEQPLKAHDLAGMRTLRQALPIPIAADEALHSLESARLLLDSEAADILVIKPQLAGGLRVGQKIIQAATERGVRSIITSTLEAGIGLVAALHLAAASPAVTLECGLATLDLLIDDLLIDDLTVRDGFLTVPTGPGLGVALDWEALHRYSL